MRTQVPPAELAVRTLAAAALLLALRGIYGVLCLLPRSERRKSAFGMRPSAQTAARRDVDGAAPGVLALIGVAVGLPLAWFAGRFLPGWCKPRSTIRWPPRGHCATLPLLVFFFFFSAASLRQLRIVGLTIRQDSSTAWERPRRYPLEQGHPERLAIAGRRFPGSTSCFRCRRGSGRSAASPPRSPWRHKHHSNPGRTAPHGSLPSTGTGHPLAARPGSGRNSRRGGQATGKPPG